MKNFIQSVILLMSLLLAISKSVKANDSLDFYSDPEILEQLMEYQRVVDSIESTFQYETGTILLKDGIASLQVPYGFKYLNPEDSDRLLTDIWGNPPSDYENRSWGMLFPENGSPLADSSYAINITYSEEGYIDDQDAKDLDYSELLETMQSDIAEANEYRIEQGYSSLRLVGWASQPFYDEENKKLHWAKELNFDNAITNTLNYNIRILGRRGYLELNAIGDMSQVERIQSDIDPIINSVDFNEGHKYANFDPALDKVAAYGIGGLIAGKVLLKAGLFAKAGILLAKFWKVIAIGAVAFFAGFKKFFGAKKEDQVG